MLQVSIIISSHGIKYSMHDFVCHVNYCELHLKLRYGSNSLNVNDVSALRLASVRLSNL